MGIHLNIHFNVYVRLNEKIMRRKLKNNEIRKIYKHGNSLGVTLPREILDEFKWRKGQKLVLKKRGKGILIMDWK